MTVISGSPLVAATLLFLVPCKKIVAICQSLFGKAVHYTVQGATDEAILDAVNNKVSSRKFHGASPTLYNLYGTMTSVVPVLGESHTFQGVALVRQDNQQVVIGSNLSETLREYQGIVAGTGNHGTLGQGNQLATKEGVVERFGVQIIDGKTVYYLYLVRLPHIFTGDASTLLAPKLPLTKPGDQVVITYYDSGEEVIPLSRFDNRSFTTTSVAH